jgi:hypothetical protein
MTSQRLTQILSGQNVRLTATRQNAYPSFLFHCYSDPNTKHFRSLAESKDDAGILGVSANLPYSHVDTKVTALLTKSTPRALQRKFIPLTGETAL